MMLWALSPLVAVAASCAAGLPHDREAGYDGPRSEPAAIADVPVHGFNVEVVVKTPNLDADTTVVEGELLAAEPDTVWVLTETGRRAIETSRINEVTIEVFPSAMGGGFATWTVFGALSAPVLGIYGVATLPVWLAGGIPAAVAARRSNRITLSGNSKWLFQYARFPQGMPARPPQPASRPTPQP